MLAATKPRPVTFSTVKRLRVRAFIGVTEDGQYYDDRELQDCDDRLVIIDYEVDPGEKQNRHGPGYKGGILVQRARILLEDSPPEYDEDGDRLPYSPWKTLPEDILAEFAAEWQEAAGLYEVGKLEQA